MSDLEEISSHTSNEGWERHDFIWEEGGEIPGDPYLYKVVIRDNEGNYYGTGVFGSLGEALNSGSAMATSYELEEGEYETIVEAYYD